MITSDNNIKVDDDEEQSAKWYDHVHVLHLKGSIKQIRTLSFKKPTVRVTSEFLGLDETLASSGRSPMTMMLVRSYQDTKNVFKPSCFCIYVWMGSVQAIFREQFNVLNVYYDLCGGGSRLKLPPFNLECSHKSFSYICASLWNSIYAS